MTAFLGSKQQSAHSWLSGNVYPWYITTYTLAVYSELLISTY